MNGSHSTAWTIKKVEVPLGDSIQEQNCKKRNKRRVKNKDKICEQKP